MNENPDRQAKGNSKHRRATRGDLMVFTQTDHLKAEWVNRVYKESGRYKTTARALHYFALGRLDYPIFNKTGQTGVRPYKDADAQHITAWLALAKRQGLISWDNLPDETVNESGELVFIPSDSDFSYQYSLSRPDLTEVTHYLGLNIFGIEYTSLTRVQPYHLELWAEKNTMNGIMQPICSRFGTVLVTFKGHCSWGSVWKMCKRVAQDGRPTIVLYLSDMDASGFRMAVELAEKITEINTNFFENKLNIRVRRIGLTPEQVIANQIPLVDRKETEKANQDLYKSYVTEFGLDPTKKAELDALERYYPGGVAAFVESWLSKFHDEDLEHRCMDATMSCIHSLPESPRLPENVVSLRSRVLSSLHELISIEDEMLMFDIPLGGSMEANITPDTSDPAELPWLLDTANGICPGAEDVDFGAREEV